MTEGTPSAPPAGWYADPDQPGMQRYWDGLQWTDHRMPAAYGAPGAAGAAAASPSAYAVVPQGNARSAVPSLVFGILSLLCCGLLAGVPAIIFAVKTFKEVDASQGRLGGRGMGIAGLVTGIIGTVGTSIMLVLFGLGAVVSSSFEHTCTEVGSPDGFTSSNCG